MKTIEMTGKTVDEALKNALNELKLTKEEVDIEIIDEGSKGIFNLIGNKPARIKITKKKSAIDEVEKFLTDVLKSMDIKAEINIKEENDIINVNLSGEKMGLIIGYRGETLDSLQYLLSLVVNKNHNNIYKKVVLDVENYRKRREETLIKVAQKVAYKVRKSKRPYKLEPMNPYERRIIHSVVSKIEGVNSKSIGEEPYRKIVIASDNPRKYNKRRKSSNDNNKKIDEPMSFDYKTSFEKDYKKPKPEDDINAGLYGKIEL